MANHKSAIKRIRQNKKRQASNSSARTALRSAIKEVRSAVTAQSPETKVTLKEAEKALSSAASKGLIHKKNAARKISRLAKLVNKTAKSSQ